MDCPLSCELTPFLPPDDVVIDKDQRDFGDDLEPHECEFGFSEELSLRNQDQKNRSLVCFYFYARTCN